LLQEYFNTFLQKKYLPVIHFFLPAASFIEQLVSVPGKSSDCRFSPEKPGFPADFHVLRGTKVGVRLSPPAPKSLSS